MTFEFGFEQSDDTPLSIDFTHEAKPTGFDIDIQQYRDFDRALLDHMKTNPSASGKWKNRVYSSNHSAFNPNIHTLYTLSQMGLSVRLVEEYGAISTAVDANHAQLARSIESKRHEKRMSFIGSVASGVLRSPNIGDISQWQPGGPEETIPRIRDIEPEYRMQYAVEMMSRGFMTAYLISHLNRNRPEGFVPIGEQDDPLIFTYAVLHANGYRPFDGEQLYAMLDAEFRGILADHPELAEQLCLMQLKTEENVGGANSSSTKLEGPDYGLDL